MFIRLAFINMSRNISRSISSFISLALASMVLTAALSISKGYPQNAYAQYRKVLGGEIIAYSIPFTPSGQANTATRQLTNLNLEQDSILPVFHPELELPGFVKDAGRSAGPFTPEEITQLAQHSGVQSATPLYQIPAHTILDQPANSRYSTPLRGYRMGEDPSSSLDGVISEGRSFNAGDEGRAVAIVNKWQRNLPEGTPVPQRNPLAQEDAVPQGTPVPTVGSKITIQIPSIEYRDGLPFYNYDRPIIRELEIVGLFEISTRTLTWTAGADQFTETVYWHANEVSIPLSTWQQLYREAGGRDYQPYQVNLHVADMNYLNDILLSLRLSYPNYSFDSVPQLIEKAIPRGLIEVIYEAPASARGITEDARQSGIPTDLRTITIVLVFVNCTLIAAVNSMLAIRERKTELAVLRTIGARGIDLIVMVVAELCFISLTGAFFGFWVIRLFGTINQISNGYSLAAIALITGRDLLVVLGLTLASSLLFALVPAISATKQTAKNLLS